MTVLGISDAPAIRGLAFRGYRGEDDLPAMLLVYNAAHEADGLEEVTTLDDLRRNYATLVNCDPARDILMAEVDGELVAYSRVFWLDLVEGGRSYENFGFVHPAWRRRGIGGAMHRHNERRLREIAAGHEGVEPKWFGSEGIESDPGNTALMRNDGYEAARYFYDMVAPSLDGITAPPLPEGIETRPVTRDQYRFIWDAMAEAFRDHWGEAEWAEEDWQRFSTDPENQDPASGASAGTPTRWPASSPRPCRSRRTSASGVRGSTSRPSRCGVRGGVAAWLARSSRRRSSRLARPATPLRRSASTPTARPAQPTCIGPSVSSRRRRSSPGASRCSGGSGPCHRKCPHGRTYRPCATTLSRTS
jgi:GNAT superfamily N-acetyltransferase